MWTLGKINVERMEGGKEGGEEGEEEERRDEWEREEKGEGKGTERKVKEMLICHQNPPCFCEVTCLSHSRN